MTPNEQQEAYRAAAVADELALAPLLGWGNLPSLESALASSLNLATYKAHVGFDARLGKQILPRWRRAWDAAGELIGRCQLSIEQTDSFVKVLAPDVEPALEDFADHPTKDDAIRCAMCKVAMAYLALELASRTLTDAGRNTQL